VPITAYRRFSKSIHRITVLYEVTVDSYRALYDSGRKRLRSEDVATATHEVTLEDKKSRRVPLSQLTFHARDVYPQMLRSTLLVRLVATYEAFLTDALRELAERSSDFLMSDQRLEFSQAHLLHLVEEKSVLQHILDKTMRSLSSGGFKEIVKFYRRMAIEVVPPEGALKDLEEIHDRRHLYVHRGGSADEQYSNTYPSSGARVDALIPVDEAYLLNASKLLSSSAKQVQKQLDAKFPDSPWVFMKGSQQLSPALEHINFFFGRIVSGSPLDLSSVLSDGSTNLGSLIIWVGRKGNEFKLLIGGDSAQALLYSKYLHLSELSGTVAQLVSEKLLR
jgi:hypothetical protein